MSRLVTELKEIKDRCDPRTVSEHIELTYDQRRNIEDSLAKYVPMMEAFSWVLGYNETLEVK